MLFSFKELILLYTFAIFIITFILLRYTIDVETSRRITRRNGSQSLLYALVLVVLLFVIIAPRFLHTMSYYGSYANPDPYGWLYDLYTIMREQAIDINKLVYQNEFYKAFPVFSLLLAMSSVVTSLNMVDSYTMVSLVTLALLALFMLHIFPAQNGRRNSVLAILIGTLTIFGNSYFCGYWDTFVPQLIGLSALGMLLLANTVHATGKSILVIVFLALGLVHVVVIPAYISVLLAFALLKKLGHKQLPKRIGLAAIALPLVVWLAYLIHSIAIVAVRSALFTLNGYFSSVMTEGAVTFATEGVHRPLAMVNAIGPSLSIGVTAAFIMRFLYSLVTKRKRFRAGEHTLWLGSISLVSVFLLGISLLWQLMEVPQGFTGGGRFFALNGFFLASLTSITILPRTLRPHRIKSGRPTIRILSTILLSLLFLGAIGGLVDPFTFKTPETANSLLLDTGQTAKLSVEADFLAKYAPRNVTMILLGKTSELLFVNYAVHGSMGTVHIRLLITKKGTYENVEFSNFLDEPSLYENVFVLVGVHEVNAEKALNYSSVVYSAGDNRILYNP